MVMTASIMLFIVLIFMVIVLCFLSMSEKKSKSKEIILTDNLIKNDYMFNVNFRKYVNEYCANNKCTFEDALKKEEIKQAFRRHTEV